MIEDWDRVGEELEDYYGMFYQFWSIGSPALVNNIPSAAVAFDKEGNFLSFLYNEEFWNGLSFDERVFIVAHEMLHLILNHGKRSMGMEPTVANIAADVVVNEMLVRYFGFERSDLSFADELCWLDTIFPDGSQVYGNNFEHYYNVLMDGADVISITPFFPDDLCDMQNDTSGFVQDVVDASGYDADNVADVINEAKELDGSASDKVQKSNVGSKAGDSTGHWDKYGDIKSKENHKWVKLFKCFFKQHSDSENEQWAHPNRRFTELPSDLILPSEHEQDNRDNNKISVWLFLDTSGSCYGLRKTFLEAYRTIPKSKFDVRLFSFDTMVQEVNLKDKKIYGGGGTCFATIERSIQRRLKNEGGKYPKIVMVFTDGEGTSVYPEFPDRWNWFLVSGGYSYMETRYIPTGSHVHMLSDFGVKDEY